MWGRVFFTRRECLEVAWSVLVFSACFLAILTDGCGL